jgi:outer membrane receptor protein involved in Fe transport
MKNDFLPFPPKSVHQFFNMKKHAILLLNLFISCLLSAQNATISGKISDVNSNEPLTGATIRSGQVGSVTDFDGIYRLNLPAGKSKIEVSFTGFESKIFEVNLLPGETRTANFTLGEADNILQTATVTAGKFEKPLGEVTVSLEVIKPKLLESTNATAVDKVLQKVPGVSIIDGQANIRGGSGFSYGAGSRVLLLIDDLPALQADAGFPNWSDVPVENISQIEVLKGAASALYGSSAMNGIINIRTGFAKNEPETAVAVFYQIYDDPKDPQKKWWGKDDSYSRTATDSFLSKQPFQTGVSLLHRRKIGKLDLVVGGYGLFQNSYERDSYKRYGRITPNFRYKVSEKLTLGLNTNFNFGKSGSYFFWANDTTGAYQPGLASNNYSTGRLRYTIDPSILYFDKFGNSHKLLGRYYSITNNNLNNQSNSSKTTYAEYQFQRKIESVGLVVTAGLVAFYSKINAKLYGDTTYSSINNAAFLQLDQKVGNRLNISAGVRYEKNELSSPEIINTRIFNSAGTLLVNLRDTVPGGKTTEGRPVFRIGANYRVGQASYFRASFGQGYRFPTIAEKFITTDFGAAVIVPNSKLTSETGWTAELGIKQGFKLSNWSGFVDLTGFISEYTNMMEFTFGIIPPFTPSFSSQNIGNTRIKGAEITLAGQGKIGQIPLTILTGYTRIDPKFRDWKANTTGSSVEYNVLKYRFRHTFKFDAEAILFKKISLGAAVIYNSNMENVDGIFEFVIPGVAAFRAANNKGFKTFDGRIAYQANKIFKISLIGANLFREEYSYRPGTLDAPRSYTLRLDAKF